MKHGVLIAILAAFLGSAFVPAPGAQGEDAAHAGADPLLARTKERYGFARWPASFRRWDGFPLADLQLEGYRAGAVEFGPGMPVSLTFSDREGRPRFLVEVTVRDTGAEAREELLGVLAGVSSLRLAPRTATAGVRAGDLGFVGYAPRERISWIAFTRGNVMVRLAGIDPRAVPYPDLSLLATAVDGVLRARPALSAEGAISRLPEPRITPAARTCPNGATVLLALEVPPARAVRWVVDGPGQGYVERGLDGRWRFHATGAGRVKLTCHVLGANATLTSGTGALVVEGP